MACENAAVTPTALSKGIFNEVMLPGQTGQVDDVQDGMSPANDRSVQATLLDERRCREALEKTVERILARLDKLELAGKNGSKDTETVDPARCGDCEAPKKESEYSATRSDERELTGRELDHADMYSASESVWDTLLFVGLPFTGSSTSIWLVVLAAISASFQLAFSYTVYAYMYSLPVDDSVLLNLLHFRLGLAHSVKWADDVSHRSMATQICEIDRGNQLAGTQTTLQSNLSSFHQGGHIMSLLMQTIWLILVAGEFNNAIHFCKAIRSPTRGPTKFVRDCGDGHDEAEELVEMTAVTRTKSISETRFVLLTVFCVIPRMLLAAFLWFAGYHFLLSSGSHADLVLNGVALGFILDIDEYIYAVLVPPRIKTIISNFEPILIRLTPFDKTLRTNAPSIHEVGEILVIIAMVIWAYYGGGPIDGIQPLFRRIHEANIVLCDGVTDFVYAVNEASGIATAVRTPSLKTFTQSERDVLQMANIGLSNGIWKNIVSDDILQVAGSSTVTAIIPEWYDQMKSAPVPETENEVPYSRYYRLIEYVEKSSAIANAELLECADYVNGPSEAEVVNRLQLMTGDKRLRGCDEASLYCNDYAYNQLRALCPVTCGCDITVDLGSQAGFFGSTQFGCPAKCATRLQVIGEVSIARSRRRLQAGGGGGGGGGVPSLTSSDNIMMCQDWPRSAWMASNSSKLYIEGIFDYLAEDDPEHYEDYLIQTLQDLAYVNYLNVSDYGVSYVDFARAMVNDTIRREWLSYSWQLGLGVPHPRGFQGCDFYTSFEVTAILGFNLCDVGKYRSLRSLCATSCGCTSKPNSGFECPPTCNHPTGQTPDAPNPYYTWSSLSGSSGSASSSSSSSQTSSASSSSSSSGPSSQSSTAAPTPAPTPAPGPSGPGPGPR